MKMRYLIFNEIAKLIGNVKKSTMGGGEGRELLHFEPKNSKTCPIL